MLTSGETYDCGPVLKTTVCTYQRDKVSEGQLDLNLHLVLRMSHRANILVVAFEQMTDQLRLLVALHCTEKR